MRLIVIRHAIAMDAEEFAETGESDDRRPITDRGAKRMKKGARGLREEVGTIDHLATSPLTRAVQTAEIVAAGFGVGDAEQTSTLVPGVPPEEFETWAAKHSETEVLAIVGHEPHLSSLVTWLLTGQGDSRLLLKKGGACLVEFQAAPRRNAGNLVWMLTPRQLRQLAR